MTFLIFVRQLRLQPQLQQKLLKDIIPFWSMKAFILIFLMLAAPQSVFFTEELQVADFLEYTVFHTEEFPEDLYMYDVIVISTPSALLPEDTIQALKPFVESGGGLMLLAEENNKEGTTLVLNQIAQAFSLTFNTDRIYDDTSYYEHTSWVNLVTFPPHPVFQGITTIVYTEGCSLQGEGILVQASGDAYAEKYDGLVTHEKGDYPACMVFLEMGRGKVFACGDTDLFDEYITLGDNALFALNVVDWLAGNPDRILQRLTDKGRASELVSGAESALQSADEKGLKEVLPEAVEAAQILISESKTLYDSYKYAESGEKAVDASQAIAAGEDNAQSMVNSRVKAAQECLSSVEKGARTYLPSQLEAAFYYIKEIDSEKTYSQKMEKADKALNLCEEIRTGLKGAAEKEIKLATEKADYKGLFGRKSHHSARIYLEYAEESYSKGNFGEALEYAQQSQFYSDEAARQQTKDYILVAVIVVLAALIGYLYVRR